MPSTRNSLAATLETLTRARNLDVRLEERNETPLIWAVGRGYVDIALTLVEAGARLDAQNSDGNTALLRAACEGRTELARVLIAVGADLDIQNHDGYSALILARRRGNHEIAAALVAAGADDSLVTRSGATADNPGHSPRPCSTGPRDAALERQLVETISRLRPRETGAADLEKRINLNADDRFVATSTLRDAYVRYEASLNPDGPAFVTLDDGLELGIVSSAVPEIACAVSSLLCRSLEDARSDLGGYIPPEVVRRVQREIISPFGVACLWGVTGHRFVLARRASAETHEILATILVARSKDTIFFFTGRYNNLRYSTLAETIDLDQPDRDDPEQRWFDRFAFPTIARFKPKAYHHIANFVVAKEHRGARLSSLLLDAIRTHYARDHLRAHDRHVGHAQHLLCGRGFWQIGDPPWLARMERLGFFLRRGAESFFIEHGWAPLPRTFDAKTGGEVTNLAFNAAFGLPGRYLEPVDTATLAAEHEHLLERVPEVIRLSRDPRAKLQYFQAMLDFL
jgi:GNAT superfamily N-acetyltransferase